MYYAGVISITAIQYIRIIPINIQNNVMIQISRYVISNKYCSVAMLCPFAGNPTNQCATLHLTIQRTRNSHLHCESDGRRRLARTSFSLYMPDL